MCSVWQTILILWKQQAEKLEAREGKQLSVRNTLQELRQEQHHLKLGKEEKQKSAVR